MLYYIVLYFVRRFFAEKPLIPFVLTAFVVLVRYCFEDSSTLFMYGATTFKWLHYFFFMLAGAYVGGGVIRLKSRPLTDVALLAVSLFVFYGIQSMAVRNVVAAHLQVFTLVPLMGIVIYTYKLCCVKGIGGFMESRFGLSLRFVAGLCLEAYIVQSSLIKYMAATDVVFPINLFITFVMIVVMAYLTRCLGRIISQIFEKEDFDWKTVVALV